MGTVGRFQLRELLGNGGFGQVYLAFDPRLDRDVALKLLRQANPGERVMQRFFREARAAGRLDHPNIVAVHDAGRDDGQCWIAYEYIKGPVLSKAREQRRIDLTTAVRITRDLADALDHAHRRGVFHRDVKPDNVLLDERGRPRLIDFGLARRDDDRLGPDPRRGRPGHPRLHEPRAGQRPEPPGRRAERHLQPGRALSRAAVRSPPGRPEGHGPVRAGRAGSALRLEPTPLAPRIPEEVDRICHKAMAHDPGAALSRRPSAGARPGEWLHRPASPPRRSRLAAGFVIGSLTTALLMLGIKALDSPALDSSVVAGPDSAYLRDPSPTGPITELTSAGLAAGLGKLGYGQATGCPARFTVNSSLALRCSPRIRSSSRPENSKAKQMPIGGQAT